MREDRHGIGTGLLLITVGLLFLGDRQGFLDFGRLWPLIIVMAGINTLFFSNSSCDTDSGSNADGSRRRARHRNKAGGGIWMVLVGVLLLANANHWMAFRDSWPLFIVAGGLSIIIGSFRRSSGRPTDDPSVDQNNGTAGAGSWR